MATIILKGSVGAGRAKGGRPHNDPDDFRIVRDRLVELGFGWVSPLTSGTDSAFIRAIKLFQCICKGRHKLDQGSGRIDAGKDTHTWLAAVNAPGWTRIFGLLGIGWRCTNDFVQTNGGFTTTWMLEDIRRAGVTYTRALVGSVGIVGAIEAPPLWIRECSPERGGHASGHGSHQTGLDVDIRLPLLPPDHRASIILPTGFRDSRFDRASSELQLKAIKKAMNTRFIFFNDPEFIRKGLCSEENASHDNHYHIRIKPPSRVEGVVTVIDLGSKLVKDAYAKVKSAGKGIYETAEDVGEEILSFFD